MNFDYSEFFAGLRKRGIKIGKHRKRITEKINQVLSYEPKIGIFGKTGAGKSSLCNALFGQNVALISDIQACTRNPQEILLGIGSKGIKLIDMPGVGESKDRDQEYAKLYAELIPELDVVLWLLKGDDRAFSTDETFYKQIVKPHLAQGKPFFIVVNQVDKIEPFREWNIKTHQPGARQLQNINSKVSAVSGFFELPESKIIPVSAAEQYNLVHLVDEIVFALPKDKQITFVENVEDDKRSEQAKNSAEKGFWETVGEFVVDVIPSAVGAVLGGFGQVFNLVKGLFSW